MNVGRLTDVTTVGADDVLDIVIAPIAVGDRVTVNVYTPSIDDATTMTLTPGRNMIGIEMTPLDSDIGVAPLLAIVIVPDVNDICAVTCVTPNPHAHV